MRVGERFWRKVDTRGHGGVALEPAITKTVAEIHAEHGERQLSREEFEELFGHIPCDGEG